MAKKSPKYVVTLNLPAEIHQKLVDAAEQTGFSMSAITRKCVEKSIDHVVSKIKEV